MSNKIKFFKWNFSTRKYPGTERRRLEGDTPKLSSEMANLPTVKKKCLKISQKKKVLLNCRFTNNICTWECQLFLQRGCGRTLSRFLSLRSKAREIRIWDNVKNVRLFINRERERIRSSLHEAVSNMISAFIHNLTYKTLYRVSLQSEPNP